MTETDDEKISTLNNEHVKNNQNDHTIYKLASHFQVHRYISIINKLFVVLIETW